MRHTVLFLVVVAAVVLGSLGSKRLDEHMNRSLTPQCSDSMSLFTLEKILFESLGERVKEHGLKLEYQVLNESIITTQIRQTIPRHTVNECKARYELQFNSADERGQKILNNKSKGEPLVLNFDTSYTVSVADKNSDQYWVRADHVPSTYELYGRW